MKAVSLGIEQLLESPPSWPAGLRVGLLCNQASVAGEFIHSRRLINEAFPGRLTCLFSPQHGFYGEKQDNMVESDHLVDPVTGAPVFSLYGKDRRPDREMFDRLDLLLVDLPDVGTRIYTFITTLAYCLEAAARFGKKIVILDRPNPIGGDIIEGNMLRPDCRSFVGYLPLPMRHGLTIGELAALVNTESGVGADLAVIPMRGWRRDMLYADTGLPWVPPSPNMPTPETALVYPGQVIWEGTNVSEGRGTAQPFSLCGAPFIDHDEVLAALEGIPLPDCVLRPVIFEPVAHKWAGRACRGFHIHVTGRRFLPYRTSLALLRAVMRLYRDAFQYKQPPYEYEYRRLPLDLILGDSGLRRALEDGVDVMELEDGWRDDLEKFAVLRKSFLLYD